MSKPKAKNRVLIALLVLVALSLLAAGCGGSGEPEESNTTAEGSSAETTAAEQTQQELPAAGGPFGDNYVEAQIIRPADEAPTEYNDAVEENYLLSCELAIGDSATLSAAQREVCQCSYDKIKQNIAFEDFKRVDEGQLENINALGQTGDATIDSIRDYIRQCS